MAIVHNQGEDYEEDIVDEDYDDESGEDTDAKLGSLFGIPIKFLIIGIAVLLLVLIAVIVFAFRGSGDDDEIVMPDGQPAVEAPVDTNTTTPVADPNTTTPVADPNASTAPAQSSGGIVGWLDQGQNMVGVSNGTAEGTVITLDGVEVGVLSATSGTPITSSDGQTHMFYVAKAVAEFGQDQETQVLDTDTELRKLGYTGDEIQAAKNSGADLNAMIESARALRDEEAKEALIRMSDSASEEFQHMANYSIFSLPYIEFPATENSFDRVNRQENFVVNADYWKLDTYGNQLFLKLKIANNTYAYMTVDPMRWSQLPETGNIVVQVNYTLFGMKNTTVQLYITSIQEKDVAQVTVSPEDSASDLTDIVNFGESTGGGTE